MNAHLIELAERRRALLVRCDEDRAELSSVFGGLERKFAVAEAVVRTARGLSRHRALVGAAGLLLVFAPFAVRGWVRRAVKLVPLALEGYRVARARDDMRGAPPVVEAVDPPE